jgi:putative DNA primase/helicase
LDEVKKQIEVVMAAPPTGEAKGARKQRAYTDPEFQQMLDHLVLIYPTMTVWDGRSKQIARIESVRLRAKWLTEEWLGHPHRRMILDRNLVFDPTESCDAKECVNLFDGFPIKPDPLQQCDLIIAHIRELSGGDEGLFDWVCKWLAYPLQRPGAKMRTALIVHGRMEGSGKSLVFEVMRRIYGRYAKKVSQRQLQSEFTAWMSQMLFCVAEEVTTPQDKYEYAGLLRNLITDPVVQINEKQLPLREEQNFANFVFLSNALMPLVLQEHDRRYTVIYYDEEHDPSYFRRLGAQIENGGDAGFLHWLLSYPLDGFDEYTRPYNNKARRELIALGMPAEQRFYALWSAGDLIIPYVQCRAIDLYSAFKVWCRQNGERFIATSTAFGTAIGKREKKKKKRTYVFNEQLSETKSYHGIVYLIQKLKEEGAETLDEEEPLARMARECQAFQKALHEMIGDSRNVN